MWHPILDGSAKTIAQQTALQIGRFHAESRCDDLSVEELAGQAVLFGYLASDHEPATWTALAEARINAAIDRISQTEVLNLALFGGLAGLGWSIEHLRSLLEPNSATDGDDDPIDDIDVAIVRELERGALNCPYDLISGLVGFGAYFIERLPRRAAQDGLGRIVELLDERSSETDEGYTWRTSVEFLERSYRAQFPDGYFNLGVAHGVPGVIVFLSDMSVAGIQVSRVERLLHGAIDWVVARRRAPNRDTVFASWFVPGAPVSDEDSRLGWCYGDLGIAGTLYRIAERHHRRDLQAVSRELIDRCVALSVQRNDIRDAGLCHGALGVAHVFNRLFHQTGEEACRSAAQQWLERGCALKTDRAQQFQTWRPGEYVDDATLLGGSVGCALSLLAAAGDCQPEWDRRLLLSSRFL